ncbi:prenylcysteine oxidase 1 [Alligator mississippiensis]|uniref:Prenylcysteine oxidase 1 n=1 Tax=Alligator mississippiensis TaxID=8496 RepID=A0A151P4Z4_ALLMI|nr:prenylcysteine oxidase 1 [Alligator mississippiensis]KYO44134.1 prenylcysteine oxidase 1 [Alligator mississippiensis]
MDVRSAQYLPAAFLLLLLGCVWSQALGNAPDRIAVIGAGIGGTSAAYYLRQKFGRDVQIDLFEREAVGGRLATIRVEGKEYEAGGSVIHPLNLHMKAFVKELGLSPTQGQNHLAGIYSGDRFVFEESGWYIITVLKLLWQYWLNPLRIYMWVEDIMDKFMRIYRYQDNDYAFTSTEKLVSALGGDYFLQLLNETIGRALQKTGFSQTFINEVVTPVMRVNYGQTVNINGFVGAVSLAGADSGLWSVTGGNKRVCDGLLSASKAQLIPSTVTSVEMITQPRASGGKTQQYEICYNSTSGVAIAHYDIVVIATPLNHKMSNITFWNFNPPIPEFSRPYHQTIATFIHGQINTSFFGYQDSSSFHIDGIFTTDNPKLFINSMGVVSPVQNEQDKLEQSLGSAVWKVFSKEPLTEEQINLLFSSYDSVKAKQWLAYPHYSSPKKCPPFILHDQMYYLSGIECAASAMEMSAIAAKNVALLAHHRWYGNTDKIDQEGLHEKLKTEL